MFQEIPAMITKFSQEGYCVDVHFYTLEKGINAGSFPLTENARAAIDDGKLMPAGVMTFTFYFNGELPLPLYATSECSELGIVVDMTEILGLEKEIKEAAKERMLST